MSVETIARTAPQTGDPGLKTWHCVDFDRPGYFLCGKKQGDEPHPGHWGIPDGEKCVVCLDIALARGLS